MTLYSSTDPMHLNNRTNLSGPVYSIFFSPITILVSLFGIIGNSLVIWFLSTKIKKNSSTVYIFNLAVADTVFLLLLSVLHMITTFVSVQPPYEVSLDNLHIGNVIESLTLSCLLGYNTSLSLLTTISVERCIAVLFPIWYHCNRPKHMSSIVCGIIWIFSCIMTVIEYISCHSQSYSIEKNYFPDSECKVVFVIICCLSFALFTPFMIVSSVVLLIKIWTSSQQRQPPKLYLVITVTVTFFLVFGMPMRILLLVWYKHQIIPPFPISDIISMFSSVNSSINPFIYFLIGRRGAGSRKFNLVSTLQGVFREEGSIYRKQQREIVSNNETIM
ncbi:proto-oncogene Mas-like [Rhinophrynus dorsalis]